MSSLRFVEGALVVANRASDQRARLSQARSSARGIALLEFAVVLPVIIIITIGFWDVIVRQIAHVRHQSALIQLSLVFKSPAVKAQINVVGGLPTIETQKISGADLGDLSIDPSTGLPKGFLPKLNALYNQIMDNIGTGAEFVEHNIAVELHFATICQVKAGCDVVTPPQLAGHVNFGGIIDFRVAGGQDNRFYTKPGPVGGDEHSCFGTDEEPEKKKFQKEYVNPQRFLMAKPSDNLPFGVKVVEVPAVGSISEIDLYAKYKPVVFMALCSRPPTITESEPIITYATFFLDKDLGF